MSLKDDLKLNKPRRTPNHATKSHVVKTNVDGKPKMIRFGEQGASTAGAPSPNDSAADKAKRKSFKARHASNIAKGPASAAYWADKVKWAEGGAVEEKEIYQIPPSYLDIAGDVVFDTVSGLVGPIAASAASLGEQAFTDNTIEEMAQNNEAYNAALNYIPRTAEGQATSDYAMGKLGEGVAYLADTYNENKDYLGRLGPIPGMIDYGMEKYNELEPETQFATENLLTVGEVIPVGKAAGMAKRGAAQGAQSVKRGVENALDLASRIEIDTNVLGTVGGNITVRPKTPGLDNLLKVESGGNLNATLIGKTGDTFSIPSGKAVSEMTMKELESLQGARGSGSYHAWSKSNMPEGTEAFKGGLGSTPVGKYQFVGNTLKDLKNRGVLAKLNITDDTVFDEQTQDRLFLALAEERLAQASNAKGKRDAMRNTWEGLKSSTDKEVDIVIAEIEAGKLNGSADTAAVLTDTPHRLTSTAREVADKRIALEKEMALLEAERSGKALKRVGSQVKIDDLAKTFDTDHIDVHGRKLDPTVAADQLIAARIIAADIDAQMTQANSGAGWYDADVEKTFEMLGAIPGLEDLQNNETKRIIWSALAAPTSINQKVINNTKAATAAMLTYARTGEIPIVAPVKDATTQGIKNAGWGMYGVTSVEPGMKVISKLIEKYGEEGFADWWLSPHTLKELTDIRKEAGLGGGPSGLSGGKDSIHLGAMVLGDKTGRFSLNINGYEGTTKDVWYSRSYNRAFGQMFGANDPKTGLPVVQGGPRNQTERRQMEAFNQLVLDNTALKGLSEADAQAVLWFYEQGLYSRLGVQSRPGSFSEGVGEVYGSLGLRQPVRGSDGIEIEIEPPTALDNFRDTSGSVRAIRANRRANARLDNGSGLGGTTGPYTREVVETDGGTGLLSFTPDPVVSKQYETAGNSLPAIRQVNSEPNAATYNADMVAAMAENPAGAQVEIKSAEDLSGYNLFRTEAGSGLAIKPDGDIVAVFASPNEPPRGSYAMLQAAVQAGGKKLDAFDTFLPKIYESAGFRPVARLPWNDEFAPPGWDKKVFSEHNNGEPDIVFFVHDSNYYGGAKDIPVVKEYDQAVLLQDEALKDMNNPLESFRIGGLATKSTPMPVNAPEGIQPLTLTREDGELLVDLTPIIGDIKGGIEGAQIIIQELKADNPNWLLIGVIGGATVAGMIPLVGVGAKKLMMKGANKFKKDKVLEETLDMLPVQEAEIVKDLTNKSAAYRFGLTDMDQNKDIATAFEEMVEDNKDLYTEDVYHFTKGTTRSVGDDVLTGDKFDPSGGNSRFNRLGTHVGTPEAANDRSVFFLGPNNDSPKGGGIMPLRARVDKPLLNSSGEVFGEEDIIPLMNRYADDNKIADLDIAADMFRQELTDQGYTHIPYTNNIEGRTDLGERTESKIMLTDRTAGDPAVLKGKFGKYEDVYDPRLMKAEGGAVNAQYDAERINKIAQSLLTENFAKGGPVTYNASRINKIANRLLEEL